MTSTTAATRTSIYYSCELPLQVWSKQANGKRKQTKMNGVQRTMCKDSMLPLLLLSESANINCKYVSNGIYSGGYIVLTNKIFLKI